VERELSQPNKKENLSLVEKARKSGVMEPAKARVRIRTCLAKRKTRGLVERRKKANEGPTTAIRRYSLMGKKGSSRR